MKTYVLEMVNGNCSEFQAFSSLDRAKHSERLKVFMRDDYEWRTEESDYESRSWTLGAVSGAGTDHAWYEHIAEITEYEVDDERSIAIQPNGY